MKPEDLRYQAEQKRSEAYELDKAADAAEAQIAAAEAEKTDAAADAQAASDQVSQ